MAYAGPGQIVEHGSSSLGRWIRARRIRLAFWIAVGEGLLIVLHLIPWWFAIVLAVAVIVLYFAAGRELRSSTLREAGVVAMGSQALVIFVPVLLIILSWLAILALVVLAVVALATLLARR